MYIHDAMILRRKSDLVSAYQWNGDNFDEIKSIAPDAEQVSKKILKIPNTDHIVLGDWVIRDKAGRTDVVNKSQFKESFAEDKAGRKVVIADEFVVGEIESYLEFYGDYIKRLIMATRGNIKLAFEISGLSKSRIYRAIKHYGFERLLFELRRDARKTFGYHQVETRENRPNLGRDE